jgi:hypothetical protein
VNDSPKHNELPLPDYDHIPLGTLPSRISGLDQDGINQLLAFEREHGNRLPVIQVLESRLGQLHDGAQPTAATGTDTPEVDATAIGSPVSPQTQGPPVNAPAHGVPGNPSQPR